MDEFGGRYGNTRASLAVIRPVALTVAAAVTCAPPTALAGGSAENAVLIIDPTNADSLYIGNYYKNARNIPDSNVLYVRSAATDYNTFVITNEAAFQGELDHRRIRDHADYVVIAPLNQFTVPIAPGLVNNECTNNPLPRLAMSGVYSIAPSVGQLFGGGIASSTPNGYGLGASVSNPPLAFHAQLRYVNGSPSTNVGARQTYISAMLGYTGANGNTLTELRSMIDRSTAVDGTRPPGTYYFMNNTADGRRNIRACSAVSGVDCGPTFAPSVYNNTAASITSLGGSALVVNGALPPTGTTGVMGVMSGFSQANISGANLGFVAGGFADQLTSYSGRFDCSSSSCQTLVSEWIRAGASGSEGSVEEPCANVRKFPTPDFHRYYSQGMSLGESYLRSTYALPFSMLLYGDPLTRPFAYIPTVSVANPPIGPKAGTILITPSASTARPGAAIAGYDLLVDGVKMASANFGQSLTLNTQLLPDGRHDLRVLARDNSAVEDIGRWLGTLDTGNYGHNTTLSVAPATGSLAQLFSFTYSASTAGLKEVRLVQNGRVLAASTLAIGTLSVYGQNLGAGTSTVKLEAWYDDGRLGWSVPVSVNVAATGTPSNAAPAASSYTKVFSKVATQIVELPARFDAPPGSVTYELLNTPTNAQVVQYASNLPYVILRPLRGFIGSEQLQFKVTVAGAGSSIGTVTLFFQPDVSVITPPAEATSSVGTASTPGRQGARAFFEYDSNWHAGMFRGTPTSWTDLLPWGATSSALTDMSDTQQVGHIVFGSAPHAVLWTADVATSYVDLHPVSATRSNAEAMGDGLQVGSVTIAGVDRASAWSGTAASRVDLHPASGASASYAMGTSGPLASHNSTVGYIVTTGGRSHAALWQNLGGWSDLHPTIATDSYAQDVYDGTVDGNPSQVVGYASVGVNSHASVWTESAASWVDLNPAGATSSRAYRVLYLPDTNQFYQVGVATIGGVKHASLWNSSAGSWIDLSAYLPAPYAGLPSEATAISSDANGIYIVGTVERAGGSDVVTWRLP